MMEGAELVGHGVVEAQEGVGEGHTGHAGGVVHLLAGMRVLGAVREAGGRFSKTSLAARSERPLV